MLRFPKTLSFSTITFLDLGNYGENNSNSVLNKSSESIFFLLSMSIFQVLIYKIKKEKNECLKDKSTFEFSQIKSKCVFCLTLVKLFRELHLHIWNLYFWTCTSIFESTPAQLDKMIQLLIRLFFTALHHCWHHHYHYCTISPQKKNK